MSLHPRASGRATKMRMASGGQVVPLEQGIVRILPTVVDKDDKDDSLL